MNDLTRAGTAWRLAVIVAVLASIAGVATKVVDLGSLLGPRKPSVSPTTAPRTTSRPVTSPSSSTSAAEVPIGSGEAINDPVEVAAPTTITIPAISVSSFLQPLGIADDGTAIVPSDPQRAGWFEDGPRPGAPGPAVILGHVDSRTGPGVFWRLRDLRPGDTATVSSAAGALHFSVDRIETTAKAAFPTAEVYGPTPGSELRLVTCGGSFDRTTGHYRDNVIVFLTAVAP